MALILDTNGLSAILGGNPEIWPIIKERGPPSVPAVVLGEYEYALRRSTIAALIRQTLDMLVSSVPLLPVDRTVADAYASVRLALREQGTPIPENDVWIASIAHQQKTRLYRRTEY